MARRYLKFHISKIATISLVPFMLMANTTPPLALNALLKSELRRLDPATRLEQRCDVEAMECIARDNKRFAPDKAVAYSFAEPIIKGNNMKAPGAAFRSHNHWYHLRFDCTAADNHIDIKQFSYKIGALIPRSEWEKYYLVP